MPTIIDDIKWIFKVFRFNIIEEKLCNDIDYSRIYKIDMCDLNKKDTRTIKRVNSFMDNIPDMNKYLLSRNNFHIDIHLETSLINSTDNKERELLRKNSIVHLNLKSIQLNTKNNRNILYIIVNRIYINKDDYRFPI